IVQAARLRDGSRRITHITEVVGLEGDVIVTQDLFVYDITGEDAHGKITGRHRSTGIAPPRLWDRARHHGLERELADALDAAAEGMALPILAAVLAFFPLGGGGWVLGGGDDSSSQGVKRAKTMGVGGAETVAAAKRAAAANTPEARRKQILLQL